MNIFVCHLFGRTYEIRGMLKDLSYIDNVYGFSYSDIENNINIINLRAVNEEVLEYAYSNINNDEKEYRRLYERCFAKYEYMMHRRNYSKILSVYDINAMFRVHYNYLSRFLKEKAINLYITSSAFSEGFDYLMYHIACERKIKTIVLENYFYDHFFWTTKLCDWGIFEYTEELFPMEKVRLPKMNKIPFYMDCVDPLFGKNDSKMFIYLKKFVKTLIFKPAYVVKFVHSRIKAVICILNKSDKYIYLSRLFLSLFYSKTNKIKMINYYLNKTTEPKFNNGKSVYFALHYQPEASTLAYTDIYEDQILAIERVSSMIASDWIIFVKENPKQYKNSSVRGELFFRRLDKIPKVKVVSPTLSSDIFINNCSLICTISGTVGWEAIRQEKPVLLFGNPWYMCMPGVKHIDNISSIDDVINQPNWTIQDIEDKFEKLTKKMGRGFVSVDYFKAEDVFNGFIKQDIDIDSSNKKTFESLKTIIESVVLNTR